MADHFFDVGFCVGQDTGIGIKHGTTAPGTFGWRDITGEVLTRGVGATDPAWAAISASAFSAYSFSLNDQCWMAYHIPHDIVPSSDVHFHAHWLSDGTDENTVKWQWDYMFAKGMNQEAFNTAGTVITAEEAASGTAHQHMVTETAAVTIASLTEPDGIIYANVTRITNGGTDNTDNIFLLTADVHYQSTNIGTVAKAPGFYG